MSDGTYSRSSESETSEGHVDRPPEGQYETGRRMEERQDEDGVEELGFPHKTLERAVTQLQKELDYCRMEFEITRRLTPAPEVNRRQPRQARFTSTQSRGTRENRIGNSTVRYLKPLCVRMVGMM